MKKLTMLLAALCMLCCVQAQESYPAKKQSGSPGNGLSLAQARSIRSRLSLAEARGAHAAETFTLRHSVMPSLATPFKTPVLRAFGGNTMCGGMISQEGWSGYDAPQGIYSWSLTDSRPSPQLEFEIPVINFGSFYVDGTIYIPWQMDAGVMLMCNFVACDAATGDITPINGALSDEYAYVNSTYVPALEAALTFGVGMTSGEKYLLKLDLLGNVSRLATISTDFYGGLTTGPDGTIYGISRDGTIYTISPTDFTITRRGTLGISSPYTTAICYDEQRDVIYYPTSPETAPSELYSIDPQSFTATLLHTFPYNCEFCVLYQPGEATAADAPGAPTQVVASFPDGAMSGTVSFLPPTLTHGGTQGSGALTYNVEVDGQTAASGPTSYGAAAVSAPVSVSRAGNHTIRVFLYNSAGRGDATTITAYIGPDVPQPPTGLQLTYSDGSMHLSWQPVTGENGGYVDQSYVTYTISRCVQGTSTVRAESITGTSYSEAYAEPQGHAEVIYYTVQASYAGISTTAVSSPSVMIGSQQPPFSDNFATEASAYQYLVIDANNDGKTWLYDKLDNGVGVISYRYHSSNRADDYLVLPAFSLKAGKQYDFSFLAGCKNYPERVGFYMGRKAEAEAFTTELIAPTDITGAIELIDGAVSGTRLSCSFIPEEDGVYYFAIKALSNADAWHLQVTNIEVSAPLDGAAPAAVTGLTLTPDPDGEPVVTIAFTAPTLDIAGRPLSSLSYVEVYRGGEFVKNVTGTPGASLSLVDNEAGDGEVTYTLTPYNSYGAGRSVSAKVYVGFDVPKAPAGVNITTGADYGEVLLTWEPVSADINGVPLDGVTYNVEVYDNNRGEFNLVADNLTECSFKARVCSPTAPQSFVLYRVAAVNEVGASEAANSDMACVGAPYTLPYYESLQLNTIMAIQTISGSGGWSLGTDATFTDVNSQDGDDAYLIFISRSDVGGDCARASSGRIELPADAINPELAFWYYCHTAEDRNTISVLVDAGEGFVELEKIIVGDGTPGRWNRLALNLDRFKGSNIRFAVECTAVNARNVLLDNFSVAELPEHDLAAELTAPATVKAGGTLTLTATVSNLGSSTEQGYSVDLLIDGKVVDTQTGTPVASGSSEAVVFSHTLADVPTESIAVQARVNLAADQKPSNNLSPAAEVLIKHPDLPAPGAISGSITEGGADLAWQAPDYVDYAAVYEADFEDADSFATMNQGSTDGWKFVDLDGAGMGGFQNLTFPNITFGEPGSWFILDNTYPGFSDIYAAHSGTKMLAAIFTSSGVQNDDWAISPELSGDAQTISFYTRGFYPEVNEVLEVLYSTTDADPASFKSLVIVPDVTNSLQIEWRHCEVALPAGAKYFAFRYRSTNQYLIFIDDVSFVPAGMNALELLGYNLYRNGEKITATPLSEARYVDASYKSGDTYIATAVYNVGESRGTASFNPAPTGVEQLQGGVSVRGLKGCIEIAGSDAQASVHDMSGRLLYRGTARHIPMPAGLYAVSLDGISRKVLVK